MLTSALSTSLLVFQLTADPADSHKLVVYAGIAAISLLVIALIILGAAVGSAIGAAKAHAEVKEAIAEFKAKSYPVLLKADTLIAELSPTIKTITLKTNTLLEDLSPKITAITGHVETIAGHAEQIAAIAKSKAEEFSPTLSAANLTVQDANLKTHQQIDRVNVLITSVLDKTTEITDTIHRGIRTPVREVAGIVTGIKAGVDSLIHKTRGFGAGFTPNPARKAPVRSSYPITPSYSTPEASAAAATSAFNRAEKPDMGL